MRGGQAVQLDAPTPTVGGLMSSDPILIWPDAPVADVADLLDRSGIGGVPVVDWSGYLVGVVSRMDLLRVRESDSLSADWSRLCARHIRARRPSPCRSRCRWMTPSV